ncbi:MAG: hypothetical protein GXP37_05505 [Chloroflexi bacterium]|nr:hypothetical protein [Chloroflexota bacterium]
MTLRQIVVPCILITILGAGALAAFTYYNPPSFAAMVLALMLVGITTAAATAPVLGRVQQKIVPQTPASVLPRLAIRQGIWAGLYVISLIILHLQNLLDAIFMLVLFIIFMLLENFLQTRGDIPTTPTRRPRSGRSPRQRPSATAKTSFQSTSKRKSATKKTTRKSSKKAK